MKKIQNVCALIRGRYNTLSDSQKSVADYIVDNTEEVMTTPLAELARRCSVSEPTIFRFLKKLGYDSYQVFRVDIAQSLAEGRNENFYSEIDGEDSPETVRDKVLMFTMRCLDDGRQIIDADAVNTLACRIEESEQIVAAGIGASYCMAYDLYHKLMRLGFPSRVSNDPHMLNIMCSQLSGKDTLICFSHSGESREITDAMRCAGNSGAYRAAITSYKNSTAANMAECSILSSSYETKFRADSMSSRILQMSIIDMIYILLVLKNRDERQEMINISRLAVARNKT